MLCVEGVMADCIAYERTLKWNESTSSSVLII